MPSNYSSWPRRRRRATDKHDEAPAPLEYPVGHAPHEEAPGYIENVFARHDVHAALPVAVLYVPALHAVNEPETAPPPAATVALPENPAAAVHDM